jgi:hypothetical protein
MAALADYFFDALLVELNKQIIRSGMFFPYDEFGEKIKYATKPAIPDSLIDTIVTRLVEEEFTTQVSDEIGGDFLKLHYQTVTKYVSDQIASADGFIFRYSQVGSPLLERVFEQLAGNASGTDESFPTTTDPLEEVPASDRIVRRGDNLPIIEAIMSDIHQVRQALREDNELGANLGDEREIIDLEFEIADEVLQKPRFRLKSLLNWLLPALSFLAEKFASGAIGETAKRLVSLLLSLI